MAEDLRHLLDVIRRENATAHEETREHFEETASRLSAETREFFEIAAESVRGEVRLVAESVALLHDELKKTQTELGEEIARTGTETDALIRFSHATLDRRVSALEKDRTGER